MWTSGRQLKSLVEQNTNCINKEIREIFRNVIDFRVVSLLGVK